MNNKANKTSFKTGQRKHPLSFGKGDKHKPEAIKKISDSLVGKLGIKARNWKGGLSDIRRSIPQLNKYKEWREVVFKRDDFTCQICKRKCGYVEADHIIPMGLIIKQNKIKTTLDALNCSDLWNIENGRTLCRSCHKNTDSYAYK